MSQTRPQPTASIVGEVLGSYRVTSEISTGGMGTVYRATHELLGRPAAIKLLRPELTTSDELVERFFNEAKAATAIRHPGIVEVYDFGYTEDGRAYLVMEFLDGESLGARIKDRGRLTEVDAAHIAKGIASALKAAHSKGIFHRDLKPDNVFLVPDPDGGLDRVKVLDFGIAKLAARSSDGPRHTQNGVLMGTPLYMAPEQARAAGTIDHRADLYSLGCMLYELLVGHPPHVAEGAGEIIAMHMFTEVQRPSARLDVLSPEMEALVMRLLEKEPHSRYQSATEVQQALAKIHTRLSARTLTRSSTLPLGGAPAAIAPTPRPSFSHELHLGFERPSQDTVAKRSALPIVLGLVTLVSVAAVGIYVMTRANGQATATPAPDVARAVRTVTPAPAAAPAPPLPAAPAVKAVDTDGIVVVHEPQVIVETSGKPVSGKRATRPRPQPSPGSGSDPKSSEAANAGPVTRPDTSSGGLAVTPWGSPINTTIDDVKPSPTAPKAP